MSEPPEQIFWERLNNLALVRFFAAFASGCFMQLLAYLETFIVIFVAIWLLLSYPVK